jgi:hypothetical protein
MAAKRGAPAATTGAPDDDEILDDEILEADLPGMWEKADYTGGLDDVRLSDPILIELVESIRAHRAIEAKWKVVRDEHDASRRRVVAAKNAAGISRSAGFVE